MQDVFRAMLDTYSINYIVVKTKFTEHHIERLSAVDKAYGRFKWTVQVDIPEPIFSMQSETEAIRSTVENKDCFPRLFYHADSVSNELFSWIRARDLTITDIRAPKV